jgi:hypothetical protein
VDESLRSENGEKDWWSSLRMLWQSTQYSVQLMAFDSARHNANLHHLQRLLFQSVVHLCVRSDSAVPLRWCLPSWVRSYSAVSRSLVPLIMRSVVQWYPGRGRITSSSLSSSTTLSQRPTDHQPASSDQDP